MGFRGMLVFAFLTAALTAGCARADVSIRPGKLVLEAPTIHSLGVRWYVSGDENGNAEVAVSFRQKGEREWRQGMSLFRVGTGPDSQEGEARLEGGDRESWPYLLGNIFAGSVLDLKADTPYEIKLVLSDPDGGTASRILRRARGQCRWRRNPCGFCMSSPATAADREPRPTRCAGWWRRMPSPRPETLSWSTLGSTLVPL